MSSEQLLTSKKNFLTEKDGAEIKGLHIIARTKYPVWLHFTDEVFNADEHMADP